MNTRQNNEIADCVRRALDKYFKDLDGEKPRSVYDMVIRNVERPLLEVVLDQADGNQTIAAEMLGINRNTLRKKMQSLKIKLS
jgi:Fis family transcriptional regulator, factor for inversion stimulation protein